MDLVEVPRIAYDTAMLILDDWADLRARAVETIRRHMRRHRFRQIGEMARSERRDANYLRRRLNAPPSGDVDARYFGRRLFFDTAG